MTDIVADLLKVLVPAAIVMYAMYLTVRSFLSNDFEKKSLDLKIRNRELYLPNRLQAYERICLLLERSRIESLLGRINQQAFSIREFQVVLVNEVRNEFNHNLAQQVYMSDKSWDMVRTAIEDMVSQINQAAESCKEDDKSLVLARKLVENAMVRENDPLAEALLAVKAEVRTLFE
ncbi:hypothetical protein FUAX_32380 [Fulvitalea axinellae]|uniref:Uncharacterized protein n=1 Tax=Fulvitalea axinellae TaxID=1182444 RepID=A0AAU9CF89_9BACT|nr:hypothetical protein FUAX_32380 [Fulvitalea axinellae]